MDDYVEPVVQEKPLRGREIKTNIMPTDMFDTMKLVSQKKTLRDHDLVPELKKKNENTAELYHEGYVDGKMYLVPDSNLEAMKDMINFKMKPRRSTRYKHQTSFELTDYDHFRGKLHTLLEKIEEFESESEEEEEEEEEEEKAEEEQKAEEEEKTMLFPQQVQPEHPEHPKHPVDPNRLRFLISGHFLKDREPIYIIQDYRGGPNLFKDQKADFYSKQREDDVDLTISGRFYDEPILEETYGKPTALNINSHRILIDDKTSNVYKEYFEQVYKFKSVNISLKGEFIKSKITKKITPFLTIDVKNKFTAEPNIRSEREDTYRRKPASTAVLVYKPEYSNPFAKGDENCCAYPVFDHHGMQSNALVLRSSIAVLTSNLQNSKEEELCESADKNIAGIRTQPDINDFSDLKTTVSVKTYDIDTVNKLSNMAGKNNTNLERDMSQDDIMNKSFTSTMYMPSYSKDVEHLDNTRYPKKKQKKKKTSIRNSASQRTMGSNSFPVLKKYKAKKK